MEVWKSIEGYGGRYSVSNTGRVKTIYRGAEHILSLRNKYKSRPGKAYYHVRLSDQGVLKDFFVHRLVAIAFHPNPENKPVVNHKDGNKFNNHADNLEWVTEQENHDHAVAMGLLVYGKVCPIYKITDETAREIKLLLQTSMRRAEIAAKYGVSRVTIYNIAHNRLWKHITI